MQTEIEHDIDREAVVLDRNNPVFDESLEERLKKWQKKGHEIDTISKSGESVIMVP